MLTQETMNQALNNALIRDLENIERRSPRPIRQMIGDACSLASDTINFARDGVAVGRYAMLSTKNEYRREAYASILADTTQGA